MAGNLKKRARNIKAELENLQSKALSLDLICRLKTWCDWVSNEDVDKFNQTQIEFLFQEFSRCLNDFFRQSLVMSHEIRFGSLPADLASIYEQLCNMVDEISDLWQQVSFSS